MAPAPLLPYGSQYPDADYSRPRSSATKKSRRGWWIGSSIGCAVVALCAGTPLLCGGGYYALLVRFDGLQTKAELRAAREAGSPVTVEEMESFYPTSPAIADATGHWLKAIALVNVPTFAPAAQGLPFVDKSPQFEELGRLPRAGLPRVNALLLAYRGALDEAHAARRAGAVARYPTDYSLGYAMPSAEVQMTSRVFNLLHLDFEAKLLAGDPSGCFEDLITMVAVAESLRNEPTFVSQSVRGAEFAVAAETLAKFLDKSTPSEEQLASLQNVFQEASFFAPGFRRSSRGEQFLALHAMAGDLTRFDGATIQRWAPGRGPNFAKTTELWRMMFEVDDADWPERLEASRRLHAEATASSEGGLSKYYALTLATLPDVEAAVLAAMRAEAWGRLAVAGIACERYRLKHGVYPNPPDLLAPTYLPGTPIDPFDGRPLSIVFQRHGVKLYSVGTNQTDEGGLDDLKNGDLVFELDDPSDKDAF